ncbi:MAG TPA: hypothetical protein DD668_10750, partial [Alphaproteobacteria bacterium]|nr:hypothetical protein [Alphaproteobacteria bacterium]
GKYAAPPQLVAGRLYFGRQMRVPMGRESCLESSSFSKAGHIPEIAHQMTGKQVRRRATPTLSVDLPVRQQCSMAISLAFRQQVSCNLYIANKSK